jgi:chromosome segregation ATPase
VDHTSGEIAGLRQEKIQLHEEWEKKDAVTLRELAAANEKVLSLADGLNSLLAKVEMLEKENAVLKEAVEKVCLC